jgi:hypothetical protein
MSKLKIGIFGDSFAAPPENHQSTDWVKLQAARNPNGKSWATIIAENPNYEVTNYAVGGSSFYFSYQHFKETYILYDKIVFVGTMPGRIYSPHYEPKHFHVGLIGNPEYCRIFDIDTLEKYYKYFYNDEEAIEMRQLMIDRIKQEENVLFLSVTHANHTNHNSLPLGSLQEFDFEIFNKYDSNTLMANDIRHNHINNENNKILAEKVSKWIDTGEAVTINKSDFVYPNVEDFSCYFNI